MCPLIFFSSRIFNSSFFFWLFSCFCCSFFFALVDGIPNICWRKTLDGWSIGECCNCVDRIFCWMFYLAQRTLTRDFPMKFYIFRDKIIRNMIGRSLWTLLCQIYWSIPSYIYKNFLFVTSYISLRSQIPFNTQQGSRFLLVRQFERLQRYTCYEPEIPAMDCHKRGLCWAICCQGLYLFI